MDEVQEQEAVQQEPTNTPEQEAAPQEQVRGIPERIQINFDTWKKIKAKGLTDRLESIIDSAFLGIETPELREIAG